MVRALAHRRSAVAPAWIDVDHIGRSNADWEPPISGAVYGVIMNVRQQVEALGEALSRPPYASPPKAPVLYIKPPNTYLAHAGQVPVPASAPALETNATLAVVIGKTACRVPEEEALDHVLGYAPVIDVCIPHSSLHRPAIRQRCRDGFLPMGPWIVERQAVADPDDLLVTVRINGEDRSRFSTADLVRPAARLIADVSDFMTLHAGDALLVGLPPDGPQARAGDRVEAEIEGVGVVGCTLVPETLA
jgi:5-oxopent-3-ene-1,2,5-tricarboxylate decarboxylase/2-hydroxyhepta-2,4-diene-1,7-dioate isomerase